VNMEGSYTLSLFKDGQMAGRPMRRVSWAEATGVLNGLGVGLKTAPKRSMGIGLGNGYTVKVVVA